MYVARKACTTNKGFKSYISIKTICWITINDKLWWFTKNMCHTHFVQKFLYWWDLNFLLRDNDLSCTYTGTTRQELHWGRTLKHQNVSRQEYVHGDCFFCRVKMCQLTIYMYCSKHLVLFQSVILVKGHKECLTQ